MKGNDRRLTVMEMKMLHWTSGATRHYHIRASSIWDKEIHTRIAPIEEKLAGRHLRWYSPTSSRSGLRPSKVAIMTSRAPLQMRKKLKEKMNSVSWKSSKICASAATWFLKNAGGLWLRTTWRVAICCFHFHMFLDTLSVVLLLTKL